MNKDTVRASLAADLDRLHALRTANRAGTGNAAELVALVDALTTRAGACARIASSSPSTILPGDYFAAGLKASADAPGDAQRPTMAELAEAGFAAVVLREALEARG